MDHDYPPYDDWEQAVELINAEGRLFVVLSEELPEVLAELPELQAGGWCEKYGLTDDWVVEWAWRLQHPRIAWVPGEPIPPPWWHEEPEPPEIIISLRGLPRRGRLTVKDGALAWEKGDQVSLDSVFGYSVSPNASYERVIKGLLSVVERQIREQFPRPGAIFDEPRHYYAAIVLRQFREMTWREIGEALGTGDMRRRATGLANKLRLTLRPGRPGKRSRRR